MKKSVLSALTPRILTKKSKGAKNSTGTTKVAASSPGKIASAETLRNKTSHVKNVSSTETPFSTNLPTLKKRNFVEDTEKKHSKGKLIREREASNRERSLEDDNTNSNSSSEEDVEYDEEALTKFLERKIEQAPAAKVIVSDAMMRGALGEINARKSAVSTTAKSSIQSMLSTRTNFSSCDSRNRDTTTSASAVSILSLPSTSTITGVPEHGAGGGGDAIPAMNLTSDGDDYVGCPLEKVLEFLQAVMTKDYKRALVLSKEVEQHEPNNELVLEYKAVLQKIVSKEDEDEESDSNGSDSSSEAEFSEDLSTSSETDSFSEEEDEDSESSTEESHSSVVTEVTAGERKSDEDEEARNVHDELEMTQSMGNKNGGNVTSQNKEDAEKAAESLHEDEDNGTSIKMGSGDLPNNGEVEGGSCDDVEQVHENNVREDVSAAEVETKDL